MSTQDLLNVFWGASGFGAFGDSLTALSKTMLGTSDDMSATQKGVVKGAWDAIANMPRKMDDYYIRSMVDILMNFGLGEAETTAIVSGFAKAKPGIPIVGGIYMLACNLLVIWQTLSKGLASAGELIDKKYRTIIRPGVGSINDWIAAMRRGIDHEGMEELMKETGMPDDWSKVIELASQWWPDVGDFQKLLRRGQIDEEKFLEMVKSIGANAPGTQELLKVLTWDVPGADNVLELYRRKGLEWDGVDEWMKVAGFEGASAELLKANARRLIDPPQLYELRRRGVIDDASLAKGIGRMGYEADDKAALAGLYEQLPDGFQLTQAYFREFINKGQYLAGLGKLGFAPDTAKMLEGIAWQLPGPADLMRFGVREVFTPAIARRFGQYQQYPNAMTKWAAKIGMSKEVAQMYWAAHWDLPAVGQMFDMFHRGIIGRADLQMGVRARDVMPYWQDKVIDLSYRLIPRRTLPRFIRQGLLSMEDAVQRFRRLGYRPDDAAIMAESASLQAVEKEREMTRADIIASVRFGFFTLEQAKAALEGLKYTQTAVAWYLADAERRKGLEDARAASESTIGDTNEALDLTRAEVVRGYSAGMVDRSEAESMLQGIGASPEATTWKLTYADLVRARKAKEHAAKHYKRLFDNHLREGTAIENALLVAGYTASESARLVAEWTLERNVDDELALIRDRKPSPADLDKWLKLGILGVDDWVVGMAEQGYPDPVIAMALEEILLTIGT